MADAAHEQIEIDAPVARCYARAIGFEEYPQWADDVQHVTVLARDDAARGTRVEFLVAGVGRRVRYVLDYDYAEAPDAFSWSLVEGDMLRALDGRYAFTPTDTGTLVDYSLRVELAVPLPGLVKRRASGMIMGNALRGLKRTVEHDVEREMDLEQPTPRSDDAPSVAPMPDPLVSSHPDAVAFEDAGAEERPLPPPSIVESVITELLGAVPEVRDHVLEAADALLEAAKALIDAADRVVRQQRGDE
jgi:uncharacterized membrane protein